MHIFQVVLVVDSLGFLVHVRVELLLRLASIGGVMATVAIVVVRIRRRQAWIMNKKS